MSGELDEEEGGEFRPFIDVLADVRPAPAPQPAAAPALLSQIRRSVVGRLRPIRSPFGRTVPLVYADWTASGRPLGSIERYMQHQVMPLYANTHTSTSITGLQSSCYRHEARQVVAESCNAKITGRGAVDVVLFAGFGSTGAVRTMVTCLGLHMPLPPDTPAGRKPVVFVGPFEHHSNLLPWRESSADVVTIREDPATGQLDLGHLKHMLAQYAGRPLKIGAFSAASNVTGVLTDTNAVTALCHRHGALAFWDYATAAPCGGVDMNPLVLGPDQALVAKDAVFISTHKLVGGPGSPGVLVAKKRLMANPVPSSPGGGTVFFVTDTDHRYLSNREEREEGGTPDVLGAVRAGLCFRLKQQVGAAVIEKLEGQLAMRVFTELTSNPRLLLCGPLPPGVPAPSGAVQAKRLPVLSFMVRWNRRLLHYNFVAAVLNDLFGVQARGGCQCAGPYGLRLLGISPDDARQIEAALLDKAEVLRPGFCRVSFPYFMGDDEVAYILAAIQFVADHGWRLLPAYRFNHKTGEWKHSSCFTKFAQRKWLSDFDFDVSGLHAQPDPEQPDESVLDVEKALAAAREVAIACGRSAKGMSIDHTSTLDPNFEPLRWFVYPSEALELLKAQPQLPTTIDMSTWGELLGPVHIRKYDGSASPWDAEVEPGLPEPTPEASEPSNPPPSSQPKPPASVAPPPVSAKYPSRSSAVAPTGPTFLDPSAAAAISTVSSNSQQAVLRPKVPNKLKTSVGKAIQDWRMIQPGDKLMLGLSGGKDSLTLLHVLMDLQRRSPVKFELACATVDPQTASFDPSPMKEYCAALNVKYFYLSEPIVARARTEMQGDSLCAFCSRMKRGLLYSCCRQEGFNKLVLAQHLDDLVESFFMSCYHGQTRTMKANYQADEVANLRVIRPLIYTRETVTKQFAYSSCLPVINENCPACFEEPKERHRVKKMLAKEESLYSELFANMRRTLLPLMDEDTYSYLEAKRDEILNRGGADRQKRRKQEELEEKAKKQKVASVQQ